MQAGKLRHNATLFSPPDNTQPDTFGDLSGAFTEVGEVWCSIEPGSGREFWVVQQMRADITHVIKMRFRSDVGPRWRLQWNDGYRVRTFELGPPLVTDERFFEIAFTAIEKRS